MSAGDKVFLQKTADGKILAYPYAAPSSSGDNVIIGTDAAFKPIACAASTPASGDSVMIGVDGAFNPVAVKTGGAGICTGLPSTITVSFTGLTSCANVDAPVADLNGQSFVCKYGSWLYDNTSGYPYTQSLTGWRCLLIVCPGNDFLDGDLHGHNPGDFVSCFDGYVNDCITLYEIHVFCQMDGLKVFVSEWRTGGVYGETYDALFIGETLNTDPDFPITIDNLLTENGVDPHIYPSHADYIGYICNPYGYDFCTSLQSPSTAMAYDGSMTISSGGTATNTLTDIWPGTVNNGDWPWYGLSPDCCGGGGYYYH